LMRRCPDTTKSDDPENGTHQWRSSLRGLGRSHCVGASIKSGDVTASVFRFEFIGKLEGKRFAVRIRALDGGCENLTRRNVALPFDRASQSIFETDLRGES